jgi:hypothetical protein
MQPEIPEGLHARFEHVRIESEGRVLSRGGVTFCHIENEDNAEVAIGVASCNVKDQFNKKIGRDISLGRALKQLEAHKRSFAGRVDLAARGVEIPDSAL